MAIRYFCDACSSEIPSDRAPGKFGGKVKLPGGEVSVIVLAGTTSPGEGMVCDSCASLAACALGGNVSSADCEIVSRMTEQELGFAKPEPPSVKKRPVGDVVEAKPKDESRMVVGVDPRLAALSTGGGRMKRPPRTADLTVKP